MRLQVFLSHNGVCSRRDAMVLVQAGRVKVNGQVVREPSFAIEAGDDIMADGQKVESKAYTYLMLNKPSGYVTTKEDPHAPKTIMELLPKNFHHLSPVGRLDMESEGLLLLTNDGTWAHELTHPKFHVDKTYFVRIKGKLGREKQSRLQEGIVLEGEQTAPCRIEDAKYNGTDTEFHMMIHEGRKRQIRLMLKAVGSHVNFLQRQAIGDLDLGSLPLGEWRHLDKKEVMSLTGPKTVAKPSRDKRK